MPQHRNVKTHISKKYFTSKALSNKASEELPVGNFTTNLTNLLIFTLVAFYAYFFNLSLLTGSVSFLLNNRIVNSSKMANDPKLGCSWFSFVFGK